MHSHNLVYNVLINGVSVGLTRNLREARSWCLGRASEAKIVTIKDEVNYAS